VVLTDSDTLSEQELPVAVQSYAVGEFDTKGRSLFADSQQGVIPLEKIKEEAIRQALKASEGNIAEAAKKLEIGRATLYRLAEKYKIKI